MYEINEDILNDCARSLKILAKDILYKQGLLDEYDAFLLLAHQWEQKADDESPA